MKGQKKETVTKALADFSYLGIQAAVCVGLGFYLGYFLDTRTGFTPVCTILLAGVGFASWIYALVQALKKNGEKNDAEGNGGK